MSYKEDNYESQAVVELAQATPQELVRERVLTAIQELSSCHAWLDFADGTTRKAFCGDQDLPEHWRRKGDCYCALYADAAIAAHLEALIEMELPREICAAGLNAMPDNWRDEYDMMRAQHKAIIKELLSLHKQKGGSDV